MARTVDSATIQLIVNGSQAQQTVSKLLDRGKELQKQLTAALEVGDLGKIAKLRKELAKNDAELKNMLSSTQRIENSLQKLDKATPKDLRNTIKEINRQLNSGEIERGSEKWEQYTDALKKAKAELQDIKTEQKAAVDTIEGKGNSIADWGNKWLGAFTIAKDAVGAAYSSMQSYVNDYAEMAEHMANVTKYTGLAADDVEELNEAFKGMDTRTSREALNDLAADAGRLGIQSKQEILDFVEAADQINVALGEDLGEDAVKNIGKLAQMFGDADSMGLKKAMLATGSTINELAQSSSANEGYLMDFTQRLAGVGKQAGMTQAQIMGLGSVLDQNSVQAEVAATALSKILQKLYQDPAQMAKAAGLDVKQFTELLKTDANAALIEFARGMNNLGGLEGMAPVLKDLSITGSGVSQTLMTIAQNTEQVTATQQQATQAFQEATSVTTEFNAQNNTVQAQLEKQQKHFHDLSVELGATLFPILNAGLSIVSTLFTVLRTVFTFVGQHIGLISTLTAYIAFNTLAVKANAIAVAFTSGKIKEAIVASKAWTVAMKAKTAALTVLKAALLPLKMVIGLVQVAFIAMTKGTKAAGVAIEALTKKLKANPYLIIAAAVAAVAYAMYKAFTRTEELTEAQKKQQEQQAMLADAHKQAVDSTTSMRMKVEQLTKEINNNNLSLEQRRKSLAELKRIVPDYHGELTKEGKLINNNTTAIKDYLKSLEDMAIAQALYDKLVEAMSKKANADMAAQAWDNALAYRAKELKKLHDSGGDKTTTTRAYGNAAAYVVEETSPSAEYNKQMKRQQQNQERSDYWHQEQKNAQGTIDAIYNYAAQQDKKNGSHIGENLANLIKNNGEKSLTDPLSGGGDDSGGGAGGTHYETKAERKEREKREREAAKQARKEEQERKKQQKKQIAEIQENEAQQRAAADAAFQAGFIDADAHRQKLLDIERDALTQKRDLYEEGTTDYIRYNEKLLELDEKQSVKQRDWSITDLKRQEQEELAAAEQRHYKELTSEEQWEADKERITLKYLDRRARYYQYYGDAENFEKTIAERQQELHDQQLKKLKWFYDEVKKLQEKAKSDLSPVAQYQSEMGEVEAQLTAGLISYEDYMKKKMAIDAKYLTAQLQGDGKGDGKGEGKGKGKKGKTQSSADEPTYELQLVANSDGFSSSLVNCFQAFQALNEKIKSEGGATWQDYAAAAEVALSAVMSGISAFSSYYQAAQQAEEAQVTAKYDAEIEAAGSSTTKGKKLEEQKQKELAAIKTKYNKKQQAMEIAQAVASTAMAAINAYASASKVSFILGPIAAAAAVAAGAIQIATIKKQHEAEAAGYYEGGFTGNVGTRKVAGVVHGGEFVMNARAVSNPALAPVLSLIDHAQRTNTVAALTPEQVSAAVIAPQRTALATRRAAAATDNLPAALDNIQSSQSNLSIITTAANQEQSAVTRDTAAQLRRLADHLDAGITAVAAIDGTNGIANQLRRYNKMKSR